MKSNRAFVRNLGNGFTVALFSIKKCSIEKVICKTWTGTLANSADPDQTPQNVASDQCLHFLFKLQERVKKGKQEVKV